MTSQRAQRGGIVMMLLFWVLLIGAGTWLIDGGFKNLTTPNAHVINSAPDGAPVRLSRNRSGHFEAPGRINGEPVTFLLDTGATYVAVSTELAERLSLTPGRSAWFNTANGRVKGHLTELDEVALGGLQASNVQGSISPGMERDTVLLGMSFLSLFTIEIAGGEMLLRLPP
ncbi:MULTISPECIES: TIGR02281 family clan AA aspartic protease [unclassified Halomonas]|uniref:retropepsin-like aspartic protease family protein n=1 Tax=unclassified Halomonas TaxID=2609666 RepID=UPI0021E44F78|nr:MULTISPECIES: TIGR02281 family clan AA aspartic protease [unclassified Halomonas]UYG00481.1 TIGR02281 family clan AA aspartic protease [Halomonas sp. GD1P12]WNL38444.1 TIGR02281 family clan AA aspartic protease [Halomonas sp. PAMB 3232]WNL41744.1 TIGR02281 family clan AA aspartic protease [Halomonas sp. PAMB 3264]